MGQWKAAVSPAIILVLVLNASIFVSIEQLKLFSITMPYSIFSGAKVLIDMFATDMEKNISTCKTKYDTGQSFMLALLLPSILITGTMAFGLKRRNLFQHILQGRPGLITPLDTLTRCKRLPYCCSFGVVSQAIYRMMIEVVFSRPYKGHFLLQLLSLLLNVLLYSVVFFHLFSSLAQDTAVALGISTCYVWMILAFELHAVMTCTPEPGINDGFKLYFFRCLPSYLCLAYLSVALPILCINASFNRRYFFYDPTVRPAETLEDIRESYQGKHVRNLLKRASKSQYKRKLKPHDLKTMILEMIYHRESGFKYPTRLLSVMFVSALLVYTITIDFMTFIMSHLSNILHAEIELLEELGYSPNEGENSNITEYRTCLYVAFHLAESISYSILVAVALGVVALSISILHMLSSFRRNLFALYRGDFRVISPACIRSGMSLCFNGMKYAGYQISYIIFGYMLLCLVLFIVFITLILSVIVLVNGASSWYMIQIQFVAASTVLGLLVIGVQLLFSKFYFLQGDGTHLRLDNRRLYFITTYFLLFYNIFLGFASCLMRVTKSLMIGTLMMSRLDISVLPDQFHSFDSGYTVYHGYIHMEASHTNPVIIVFIRLLETLSRNRKKHSANQSYGTLDMSPPGARKEYSLEEIKAPTARKKVNTKVEAIYSGARFNWLIAYTLLQNPTIRIYRRGFIQLLNRAVKEGLKIPISDKPIYLILSQLQHGQKKKKKKSAGAKMRSESPTVGRNTPQRRSVSYQPDTFSKKSSKKAMKKTTAKPPSASNITVTSTVMSGTTGQTKEISSCSVLNTTASAVSMTVREI